MPVDRQSPPANGAAPRPVSLLDRLRSAYHGVSLTLSEAVGRVHAPAPEVPAGTLRDLAPNTAARIAALAARYAIAFERDLGPATALAAYEYLDWLDAVGAAAGGPPAGGGELHDVGCASFWYAAALEAYFRPARLLGIELEGKRRLRGRVNRHERALGYLARLPHAEYRVASYLEVARPARVITAFFPFVTPGPVLAWRLPLTVLEPQRLFARIAANLEPGGELVMVNHGLAEAAIAERLAAAAGLAPRARLVVAAPLTARIVPPVVSRWSRVAGRRGRPGVAGSD